MEKVPNLHFDNRFVRALPVDPETENRTRRVTGAAFSRVSPTPVAKPEILAWSEEAAALLDLASPPGDWEAHVFSGNRLLPGMEPVATRYGGHQFGHWADQLGDGRAISLGEVVNRKNERWEIQLKGAGTTPYSRGGDGRAVLRSSLREFLCSEAMHHLGIPTTRALCLIGTGEPVVRDMFYDGRPRPEPGAIVTRLSPSFLRFGHFEILAASGETDLLRRLTEHTIETFFPDQKATDLSRWFGEICERTARLMVDWFRVGFVHGVMNTDNMSILGLTIDYGPYGWLDAYDPNFTPNTTDFRHRRYRFTQQPAIALWNLERLAQALAPLVPDAAAFESGLQHYRETFDREFRRMMAAKLGLPSLEGDDGLEFLGGLSGLLQSTPIDMTVFYRRLADLQSLPPSKRGEEAILHHLADAFYKPELPAEVRLEILRWTGEYFRRLDAEGRPGDERRAAMNAVNPFFIPRNYLTFQAIEALEAGDGEPLRALMRALRTPYEENENTRPFAGRAPDWAAETPGCSALSCSS